MCFVKGTLSPKYKHMCTRTHAHTHLVDLWWWELCGPLVQGPLDDVLRRPSSTILLDTVPGLPASREELDGGVAPDL